MNKPIKIIWACLLLLMCTKLSAQWQGYTYMRELPGVNGTWHEIVLPGEVLGKLTRNYADIRLFGVTANKDTVEAPYILQWGEGAIEQESVAFKLINQSNNEQGHFFTFELPAEKTINEIRLDIAQQNFDRRLRLEGSLDMHEWYTVVDDYRILSIKNEHTDYTYTAISFPDSKYRYFRLLIKDKEEPGLVTARVLFNNSTPGAYVRYRTSLANIAEDKKNRQTILDIELPQAVPVCKVRIAIGDKFDYYRPMTISYVSDSVKTQEGQKYMYNTITSATLSSVENKEYTFASTVVRKLRIVIDNQDNKALHVDSVAVLGYVHVLIARFTESAQYYMVYGNKQASSPQYDISRFPDKIPEELTTIELGSEQVIAKQETAAKQTQPLFQNKVWLWGIMAIIIIMLGWFTLKMMRQK